MTSTTHCKKWSQLPPKARTYLRALAELTAARLTIVSVGPARAQTIFL
jgi:adenylosuccinate synthase